ncbi:MAG: C40 family peptidase [Candidatus Zixiibacteriota bacterium]
MKIRASLLIIVAVLAGCQSYPRYNASPPTTPEEKTTPPSSLTTNDIIRFGQVLQKYLGRPYKGTSKYDDGLDCSRFTFQVYRDFNRTYLPNSAAAQFREGVEVNRRLLRFGDLVFFNTDRNKISHVGIYVGHNCFMHASSTRGVIISSLSEEYWAKNYVSARRILNETAQNR